MSPYFITEMEQLGYGFDVDEVKKELEDAKLEISSNGNIIMTRQTSLNQH
jgi:hypothetical protein